MHDQKITQVIGITPNELSENILTGLRIELNEISKNFIPKPPEEYITRKEVSILFKVSLKTISEWSKIGILKPYRLGKFIRFKRSEIDDSLISIMKKS